jgi:hypothetical protein
MSQSRGSATATLLILLTAMLAGAGSAAAFAHALQRVLEPDAAITGAPAILAAIPIAFEKAPAAFLIVALAPIVVGFVGIAAAASAPMAPPVEEQPADTKPAFPPEAPALRLLALLQQEGRLLDFVEEDIEPYSDAQVGAAVRSIHGGCRKALHERMEIQRILAAEDGSTVDVATGFDPATIRLTGNVHGQPPFRGTLQHGGWRAVNVRLPEPTPGLDLTILAPAEVEIA